MQKFYRTKLYKYLKYSFRPSIICYILAFIFLTDSSITASAAEGQSINTVHISLNVINTRIKEVFGLIEQKTNFSIGYDNALDINQRVSVHIDNQTVNQTLQAVLKNYNGTISQVDNYHILIKVEKKELSGQSSKQKRKVTGKIVDETNSPLPGVSVREKGTSNGVLTNISGNYTIVVDEGATLVFSFVGYTSQEVVTGAREQINIALKPNSNILNEVVAVGYQTVRKSDFTGSISSVKASEINTSAPTLGQGLVGKIAGVQVAQVSGAPYETPKITVRGVGSLYASSDPLYVIDGYPAGNDLFINPQDVESVDVLKDAASAAIYGSRAAGGVVLITTKHGPKNDSPGKFEYDLDIGMDQLAKKVKLLDADQFAQLAIDGRNNTYKDLWVAKGNTWNNSMYSDDNATRIANVGNAASVSIQPSTYDFATQTLIHQTTNTDWQNELYRNALTTNNNLSFSGNSGDTRYYFSTGYQNQNGIMLGTGQQKINLRANVDGKIGKKLTIMANVAFTQNTNQETQDGRWDHSPALGALIYLPNFPAYNPDGSIATNLVAALSPLYGYQAIENPIATATEIKITRVGNRATYNTQATYEILKDFTFKANLGMQTYGENYNYYLPTSLSNGSFAPYSAASIAAAKAVQQTIDYRDELGEFTLNYSKQIKKNHFDALAGYSAQKTINNVLEVQGIGFQNDNIPNITGAAPSDITLITPTSGSIPEGTQPTGNAVYTLVSYFSRINYNYDGKYFLSGSIRTDGSSRFGPDNRYAVFPSVSAGYNLSDESFYHNWLGDQSSIKLRASWGLSGNNNIGNYNTQQTVNSPISTVFGNGTALTSAITPGSIKDQKLGWETTSQYNFGIDVGLLKGRLFIIGNYYLSDSYNLLFNQPVSALSGSQSILTNLNNSKVSNKGFDLQLDGKPIVGKDFNLDISGNISFNRNKVLALGNGNTIITNGAERSYLTNITETGEPIGMFYGYKVGGIVQQSDMANIAADQAVYKANGNSYPAGYVLKGHAQSSFSTTPLEPGDLWFVDTNHDGIINSKDAGVIGNPYPKFTYGFAVNATYKNFYFSTSFNGSYGNQVLDGQDYYLYNMEGSGNQYEDVANRYINASDPGAGTVYRASRGGDQSNSTRLSTFYLQSGSYLRCTNATIGYNIKSPFVLKNLGLSSLKVFGSTNNLFTITKYKGYNPDVDYDYSYSGSQGTNITPGVDYGVYPLVRSYNLGIKAIF